MTKEDRAINYVLAGGHPGNALQEAVRDTSVDVPHEGLDDPPEFAEKMIKAVPSDWNRFRELLVMWLQTRGFPLSDKYRIKERGSVSAWKKQKEEEERLLYLQLKKKFG